MTPCSPAYYHTFLSSNHHQQTEYIPEYNKKILAPDHFIIDFNGNKYHWIDQKIILPQAKYLDSKSIAYTFGGLLATISVALSIFLTKGIYALSTQLHFVACSDLCKMKFIIPAVTLIGTTIASISLFLKVYSKDPYYVKKIRTQVEGLDSSLKFMYASQHLGNKMKDVFTEIERVEMFDSCMKHLTLESFKKLMKKDIYSPNFTFLSSDEKNVFSKYIQSFARIDREAQNDKSDLEMELRGRMAAVNAVASISSTAASMYTDTEKLREDIGDLERSRDEALKGLTKQSEIDKINKHFDQLIQEKQNNITEANRLKCHIDTTAKQILESVREIKKTEINYYARLASIQRECYNRKKNLFDALQKDSFLFKKQRNFHDYVSSIAPEQLFNLNHKLPKDLRIYTEKVPYP